MDSIASELIFNAYMFSKLLSAYQEYVEQKYPFKVHDPANYFWIN